MTHPEERLRELGIELPDPVAPVASYVPAVQSGDQLWISGQGPFGFEPFGKVGAEVTVEQGQQAARLTCLYGLAAAKAAVGDLGRIRRVVKLTVFVNSAPGFVDQPKVANGASDLLQEVFGEHGRHARSAVGVAELPFGIPVEIEYVFEVA